MRGGGGDIGAGLWGGVELGGYRCRVLRRGGDIGAGLCVKVGLGDIGAEC